MAQKGPILGVFSGILGNIRGKSSGKVRSYLGKGDLDLGIEPGL